jgi:ribosomal protein L2
MVRGKAMNVFDHPNGGYKHSSKLLKTFKGKKILK